MSRLKQEITLAGLDYCVKPIEDVNELERKIEDHRLLGLSQIEELIQLLLVNPEVSKAIFKDPMRQVRVLSDLAKKLREV